VYRSSVLVVVLGCQQYPITSSAPSAPPPSWHIGSVGLDLDLEGVWAARADDVFAVGAHGTIVHSHDAVTWIRAATPTTADLHAICGTGPDDIYAVGDHVDRPLLGPPKAEAVVLHSRDDGATWQALPIASDLFEVTAVWCTEGETIVAGTYGDKSRAPDSGPLVSRTTIDSALVLDGHALPAGGPCLGCNGGAVISTRDRGATWTGGMTMRILYPRGVWGIGHDVWLTGHSHSQLFGGFLVHSRDGGASFDAVPASPSPASVHDFIMGSFNAVWARGPDDVYVVGDTGIVYHAGKEQPTGLGPLAAVWGTATNVLVAGKRGTLARVTDSGIDPITLDTDRDLAAIAGLDDRHVYVVGAHGTVARFE
jgi:photosystem II stability/assembly factor-like uncharacterized protein